MNQESHKTHPVFRAYPWWVFALGVCLVLITNGLCRYGQGENSYVKINDNLDSYLPTHSVLARGEHYWVGMNEVFEPILGGIPRNCLPSELRLFILPYRYMEPFHAYIFAECVLRLVAFVGMTLLLKQYLLPNDMDFVVFGGAACFALLPFYIHVDLSVAGQPLLLYAVLGLRNRNKSVFNWLIIFLYPFTSSLVFIGFVVLPLVFTLLLYESAIHRRPQWPLFAAFLILAIGYIVADYRLFYQSFMGAGYTSHRLEFNLNFFSVLAACKETIKYFCYGDDYNLAHQMPVILFAALVAMIVLLVEIRRRRRSRAIPLATDNDPANLTIKYATIVLGLILLCFAISFLRTMYYSEAVWAAMTSTGIGMLKFFQPSRISYLQPFSWSLIFVCSLAVVARVIWFGRFVALAMIVLQCVISIRNPDAAENLPVSGGSLSFRAFYSPNLFTEVKEYIGRPQSDYRVASLGIHPAVALYNGFYMVDGYWVNYPLDYKHRFREIIAPELAKNEIVRWKFDNHGSRCYLFASELDNDFLHTKHRKHVVQHLDIDTQKLKNIGCSYIISAVKIMNSADLNLKLEKVFERDDSPWQIFLYSL